MENKYVSIHDIFGDNEIMTHEEIMKAGNEMNLTDINIKLLIQRALDYKILMKLFGEVYIIYRLPY